MSASMGVGARGVVRQIVPLLVILLCLVASVLSAAPWMRSFPVSVAAAPLYGAALLSVLVPLIVTRLRPTWLWLCLVIDTVAFVIYTLMVVLQDPTDVTGLITGLYRGPSELLTFALPLVSPRSLMVAPVALIWLAGALAGECIARKWYTMLPYIAFLVAFGLAYAGTQRAAGSDLPSARVHETLLAAGLLASLLLMRVAQAWVRQDETAETTQPDGILPLRGLVIGTVTTLVIATVASFAVQPDVFPKRSATPERVPTVNDSKPLTPLAFIAGLRPRTFTPTPQTVFTVSVDKSNPGYFAIANIDFYDGSGWSFDRTFRPSGGVIPDDADTTLRTTDVVTQQYRISSGALTSAPWMPFLSRAQKVTGMSVNIDTASGMIVPAGKLDTGSSYTVRSNISASTFAQIKAARATADTATPTIDTQLPGTIRSTLDRLVTSFTQETGIASTPALPFLQALQKDLQTNYALSSAARGGSTGAPQPSATSSPTSPPTPTSTPTSTPKSTPKTQPESKSKSTPKSKHSSASTHRPRDADVRALAKPSATTHHSALNSHSALNKHSAPSKHSGSTRPPGSRTSTSPADQLAGGTSFADVLASILGPDRSGTPEQFATLVALVARDLGVPARVVTGFRIVPPAGAVDLGAGKYTATTDDAWTWVEIPLVGAGWVVLDASPARFSADNKPTQSGAPPPPSSSAPPSQNALVTQGGNGHAVAKQSPVPHTTSAPRSAVLIALLVAVGVLLLVALLILLSRKRVRAARRRRSPDPRTRLIGAWRESLDVLTEAGLPELSTMTSAEIAALTGEQFGEETGAQAQSLGSAANSVAYSAATVIAPAEADAAWERERTLRKAVRRQLGVRGRMAASLRYHRPKTTERPVSPPSWAAAAAARRELSDGNRRTGRRYRGRRRAH